MKASKIGRDQGKEKKDSRKRNDEDSKNSHSRHISRRSRSYSPGFNRTSRRSRSRSNERRGRDHISHRDERRGRGRLDHRDDQRSYRSRSRSRDRKRSSRRSDEHPKYRDYSLGFRTSRRSRSRSYERRARDHRDDRPGSRSRSRSRDDSAFFHALLNVPIKEVNSTGDLPINHSSQECITTYTDPSTNIQVICLPHYFPKSSLIESHVIFIRPFNLEMIKAMIACMTRRIVVVGNAGIGKSYLQLVILLWWARRELRPDCTLDDFFDGIDVIARVERDNQTDLFFKHDQLHYSIEHVDRPKLSYLDSKTTLLLYEPCESKNEIHKCGITDGRVWATVSPLPSRYKEFSKTDCAVKYMECATEDELLFMAAVKEQGLDDNSPLKDLYKPASVRERIQTLGPFQRVVLPTSIDALAIEARNKADELDNLTVEKAFKARKIAESSSTDGLTISHHILRISPKMNDEFRTYTLKPASNQVVEKLRDLVLNADVLELKRLLAIYNQNSDSMKAVAKQSIPSVLDEFFVKYAVWRDNRTDVSQWKHLEDWTVAKSKFSSTPEELESGWTPNWAPFSLKVTHIDRSKTPTYAQIVSSPNAIFYMNDPVYPFVDFYWYDTETNTVNAGQASKSFTGHPKYVKTFNAMKEKLQVPVDGKLVINIIPLPIQADSYANRSRGKFFADVKKDAEKISEIQKNVEFHVIKMVLS